MYVIKFDDDKYYSEDHSWKSVELNLATQMKYRDADNIRVQFKKLGKNVRIRDYFMEDKILTKQQADSIEKASNSVAKP